MYETKLQPRHYGPFSQGSAEHCPLLSYASRRSRLSEELPHQTFSCDLERLVSSSKVVSAILSLRYSSVG